MNSFAVMGQPISHSLSPILHNAAFAFLGIGASYISIEKAELQRSDLTGFSGLSLTMPLKLDAFGLANTHDDESLKTGVSNTLLISGDQVSALNTDVYGISKSIEKIGAKTVQIIGTGATAKSAAVAVEDKVVVFAGRNISKLDAINSWAEDIGIRIGSFDEVDLVIDTTPADAVSEYLPHSWVMDVAYNSERNADKPDLISGLEMLLNQAVVQNIAFSQSLVSEEIDIEQLTKVMRLALVGHVGEWSNA